MIRKFWSWFVDHQRYQSIWVAPPDFKRGIFMYDVNARCFVFFRRIYIVVGVCTPEKDVL